MGRGGGTKFDNKVHSVPHFISIQPVKENNKSFGAWVNKILICIVVTTKIHKRKWKFDLITWIPERAAIREKLLVANFAVFDVHVCHWWAAEFHSHHWVLLRRCEMTSETSAFAFIRSFTFKTLQLVSHTKLQYLDFKVNFTTQQCHILT